MNVVGRRETAQDIKQAIFVAVCANEGRVVDNTAASVAILLGKVTVSFPDYNLEDKSGECVFIDEARLTKIGRKFVTVRDRDGDTYKVPFTGINYITVKGKS